LAHEGGELVSPLHQPALPHSRYRRCLLPLEAQYTTCDSVGKIHRYGQVNRTAINPKLFIL